MVLRRGFFVLLLGWACACAAAPPVLPLPGPEGLDLALRMEAVRVPVNAPVQADALWTESGAAGVEPTHRWRLFPGERLVGRATLEGSAQGADYVVEVPIPSLDEAHVWYREQGGPWRAARAGDLVAMRHWPFANQFPAFPVAVGAQPVDLIVAAHNNGVLRVPVTLLPDRAFRENNLRRANLSGLVLGLGLMITIVCLIGAVVLRRREHWLLAAVSAWTLLAIATSNGYHAVWLTPDGPAFNDASKHFTAIVMAGLFVPLVAQSLDPQHVRRGERLFAAALLALALAYATAQALWLPHSWRIGSAFAAASLCVLSCTALSMLNALRGGRYARWVGAGVLSLATASSLVFLPQQFIGGIDLRALAVAVVLYCALLLLRHALSLRERYGRDVLSRAAISADRDPLTALWSYEGFQLRHAEAALREAAGHATPSMMLFQLPGLERTGAEYGIVLTERALVRFAAALQNLLGHRWVIGRLSKTRFAAVSLHSPQPGQLVSTATRVLSHCTRMWRPLSVVTDFDMRIVCRYQRLGEPAFVQQLREMEEAGRSLNEGKRITLL